MLIWVGLTYVHMHDILQPEITLEAGAKPKLESAFRTEYENGCNISKRKGNRND